MAVDAGAAGARQHAGQALIVGVFFLANLVYVIVAKLSVGTGRVPDFFAVVALVELGVKLPLFALLFGLSGGGPEELRQALDARLWALCAPYACGYLLECFLFLYALQFLSGSSAILVVQLRLLLDAGLGRFALGHSLTWTKIMLLLAILGGVLAHAAVVPPSLASPDPHRGQLAILGYCGVSALVHCYWPFVLPRLAVRGAVLTLVYTCESFVLGVACYAWRHQALGTMPGEYALSDGGLVLAWGLLDVSFFYVMSRVSPLALTLVGTLTIPASYVFELWYFGLQLDLPVASTALCLSLSVVAYAAYQGEREQLRAPYLSGGPATACSTVVGRSTEKGHSYHDSVTPVVLLEPPSPEDAQPAWA